MTKNSGSFWLVPSKRERGGKRERERSDNMEIEIRRAMEGGGGCKERMEFEKIWEKRKDKNRRKRMDEKSETNGQDRN